MASFLTSELLGAVIIMKNSVLKIDEKNFEIYFGKIINQIIFFRG